VEDGFQTIRDVNVPIISPLGDDLLQGFHENEKLNGNWLKKRKTKRGIIVTGSNQLLTSFTN
jgi:hypothetical protein